MLFNILGEGAIERPASEARLIAMSRCLRRAAEDDAEGYEGLLRRVAVGLSPGDRGRLDRIGKVRFVAPRDFAGAPAPSEARR